VLGLYVSLASLRVAAQGGGTASSPPATANDVEVIKTKLDAYSQRTDNLQRLMTFLLTLTTGYAVVLGVTSFLSSRQYIEQAKDSVGRVEKLETGFRQQYPMLTGFDQRVSGFVRALKAELNGDDRGDYFPRLTPETKQWIRLSEQGIAFLQFLDTTAFAEDLSEIYRALGKFSGAEAAHAAKVLKSGGSKADGVLRDECRLKTAKAQRYYENAHRLNPRNFVAMNDLAFLLYSDRVLFYGEQPQFGASEEWYRKSLDIQPHQQRPYYNLAGMYMDERRYREALELLDKAEVELNWQVAPSAERLADVRYNIACCSTRLAQAATGAAQDGYLDRAEELLLRAMTPRTDETRDALKADVKSGEDLEFLKHKRPKAIGAAGELVGLDPGALA